MTQRLEFYKCEICGNLVQVMHGGEGELVCCGKPMNLLNANGKEEEKQEKHVPVFLNGVEIQVGSVPHPMTEEHHIEFIECCTSDNKDVKIRFLDLSDKPSMVIRADDNYENAVEFCNLHGLWHGSK